MPEANAFWRVPLKILLAVVIALQLTACSSVKFAYNRLDRFADWYLDDYIVFTNEQQELFERVFDLQWRWHRKTQLPQYAALLKRMEGDLQDGFSAAALAHYHRSLYGYWRVLAARLAPSAAAIFSTASARQIDRFLQQLENKNREFGEKYVKRSRSTSQRKLAEYANRQLKRWTGSMSDEQRRLIADWSRRFEPMARDSLAFRRQWQARLRVLLQRRDAADFGDRFVDLVVYPENHRPLAYQQKLERNRKRFKALMLDIERTLSLQQRQHLRDKLLSLAEDFEQLAAQ